MISYNYFLTMTERFLARGLVELLTITVHTTEHCFRFPKQEVQESQTSGLLVVVERKREV